MLANGFVEKSVHQRTRKFKIENSTNKDQRNTEKTGLRFIVYLNVIIMFNTLFLKKKKKNPYKFLTYMVLWFFLFLCIHCLNGDFVRPSQSLHPADLRLLLEHDEAVTLGLGSEQMAPFISDDRFPLNKVCC